MKKIILSVLTVFFIVLNIANAENLDEYIKKEDREKVNRNFSDESKNKIFISKAVDRVKEENQAREEKAALEARKTDARNRINSTFSVVLIMLLDDKYNATISYKEDGKAKRVSVSGTDTLKAGDFSYSIEVKEKSIIVKDTSTGISAEIRKK